MSILKKPDVNDYDGVWPHGEDAFKWNTEHQENALKFFIALAAYYRSCFEHVKNAVEETRE